MAKVTIVIQDVDKPSGRQVLIDVSSDPPFGSAPDLSPAQELAHYLNEMIQPMLESKEKVPQLGERN